MRQTGSCHPVSCVREIDRGMRRERESCLGVGGLVDLKNMCHSYTPTAAADAAFNYKSSVAMPSSLYTPCFVLVFFFFGPYCTLYATHTAISHTHVHDASPCSLSQVHFAREFNANKLVLLPFVMFFSCGG